MKYPTTKIVIVAAVGSLLATALATSAEIEPNFDDRWTSANNDLMKAQPAIPYAQLHAKALEILRGRILASDEAVTADAEAKADAEVCVVFEKTTLEQTQCK